MRLFKITTFSDYVLIFGVRINRPEGITIGDWWDFWSKVERKT